MTSFSQDGSGHTEMFWLHFSVVEGSGDTSSIFCFTVYGTNKVTTFNVTDESSASIVIRLQGGAALYLNRDKWKQNLYFLFCHFNIMGPQRAGCNCKTVLLLNILLNNCLFILLLLI